MLFTRKKAAIGSFVFISLAFVSCYRNDIQFGNLPQTDYTRLVYIDTIEPRLSTLILDSFSTNSPGGFLLGKYKDALPGNDFSKTIFSNGDS